MTVGYRNSGGVDFDSLFDPYVQGTPPANTGYRAAGGADLAGRYAPIAFGTKGPDVGYRTAGGVDLSNLWAAFGTAVYFPTNITANAASFTGLARSASIGIAIKTNGTIVVSPVGVSGTTGGGTYNYVPTAGGASAPYDFRVRGTVVGVRNSGTTATLTGKGGVNYSAGLSPTGSTAAFDTGWITAADDAANFLTLSCSSPANQGASLLDVATGVGGGSNMIIEVRRKSDSVVVFSTSSAVQCQSDSQS